MIWKSRLRAAADRRAARARQIVAVETARCRRRRQTSCRMPLPTVVLPQPDSPTSASVRPAGIASDTPSTAFTWPTTRLKHALADREMDLEVGDLQQRRGDRRRATNDGTAVRFHVFGAAIRLCPASVALRLVRIQMAQRTLVRPDHRPGRLQRAAAAPRRSRSARQSGSRRSRWSAAAPVRGSPPASVAAPGGSGSEANSLREYGCAGRGRKRRARAVSTISPGVHHGDAVRHLRDDAQVVGDQQDRHAASLRCSSRSSSRTCAWIVTSSAVVGSSAISSAGLAGQRDGDHHALLHAARQLERILVDAAARHRACPPRRAVRSTRLPHGVARAAPYGAQHFRDLRAHGHHRIQAGARAPGRSSPMRLPRTSRIADSGSASRSCPSSRTAPADDAAGIGQQAHDRQRGHRFAAAGLAQQREGLAAHDAKRHAVDRAHDRLAPCRARCAGLRPRAVRGMCAFSPSRLPA